MVFTHPSETSQTAASFGTPQAALEWDRAQGTHWLTLRSRDIKQTIKGVRAPEKRKGCLNTTVHCRYYKSFDLGKVQFFSASQNHQWPINGPPGVHHVTCAWCEFKCMHENAAFTCAHFCHDFTQWLMTRSPRISKFFAYGILAHCATQKAAVASICLASLLVCQQARARAPQVHQHARGARRPKTEYRSSKLVRALSKVEMMQPIGREAIQSLSGPTRCRAKRARAPVEVPLSKLQLKPPGGPVTVTDTVYRTVTCTVWHSRDLSMPSLEYHHGLGSSYIDCQAARLRSRTPPRLSERSWGPSEVRVRAGRVRVSMPSWL